MINSLVCSPVCSKVSLLKYDGEWPTEVSTSMCNRTTQILKWWDCQTLVNPIFLVVLAPMR